jgi:hypothetical protein
MQKDYETRALDREYAYLQSRQKLGVWREEECPDVETSLDRISWILNGSYGCGAMLYAKRIIENNIAGKTGKNLEKAWLAVGRELTLLVAVHDTTEYTARKITECWKAQNTDFAAVNAQAAALVKEFLENEYEA